MYALATKMLHWHWILMKINRISAAQTLRLSERETETERQSQSQPQDVRSEKSRTSPYPQEVCVVIRLSLCLSLCLCLSVCLYWLPNGLSRPKKGFRLNWVYTRVSKSPLPQRVFLETSVGFSQSCKMKFEMFPNLLVNCWQLQQNLVLFSEFFWVSERVTLILICQYIFNNSWAREIKLNLCRINLRTKLNSNNNSWGRKCYI